MMSDVQYDSERACDDCGKFGAHAFGDEWLCLDCYEGRGSCCAERTMFVDEERCGSNRPTRAQRNPGEPSNTAPGDSGSANAGAASAADSTRRPQGASPHPDSHETGPHPKVAGGTITLPPAGETHRVSANCCYEACPGCSYVKKLRDFQSRHPHDWQMRLRGLPRIVAKAQARN